jgi:FAD-linked sulfhydryl oxidase
LHYVAANFPLAPTEKDVESYIAFFEILPMILPCASCKFHFAKLLREDPVRPHAQSRELLSEWLWRAHNTVNVRTGKQPVAYQYVSQRYVVGASTPAQKLALKSRPIHASKLKLLAHKLPAKPPVFVHLSK